MLLTEDEAKTKECRVADATMASLFPRCAGSGCMHWRWSQPEYEFAPGKGVERGACTSFELPEGDGWESNPVWMGSPEERYRRLKPQQAQRGYCGLAGHP